MLDWVPCHTSDQHAVVPGVAVERETSPKRDWYVWRDPAPDGGPPNNWLSIFGGPAWEWDEATGQYYLHSFLGEQPDLNWRNPEVRGGHARRAALLARPRRRRLPHRRDPPHRRRTRSLRDNPLRSGPDAGDGFGGQQHVHDENHPDVHGALRDIRRCSTSTTSA